MLRIAAAAGKRGAGSAGVPAGSGGMVVAQYCIVPGAHRRAKGLRRRCRSFCAICLLALCAISGRLLVLISCYGISLFSGICTLQHNSAQTRDNCPASISYYVAAERDWRCLLLFADSAAILEVLPFSSGGLLPRSCLPGAAPSLFGGTGVSWRRHFSPRLYYGRHCFGMVTVTLPVFSGISSFSDAASWRITQAWPASTKTSGKHREAFGINSCGSGGMTVRHLVRRGIAALRGRWRDCKTCISILNTWLQHALGRAARAAMRAAGQRASRHALLCMLALVAGRRCNLGDAGAPCGGLPFARPSHPLLGAGMEQTRCCVRRTFPCGRGKDGAVKARDACCALRVILGAGCGMGDATALDAAAGCALPVAALSWRVPAVTAFCVYWLLRFGL